MQNHDGLRYSCAWASLSKFVGTSVNFKQDAKTEKAPESTLAIPFHLPSPPPPLKDASAHVSPRHSIPAFKSPPNLPIFLYNESKHRNPTISADDFAPIAPQERVHLKGERCLQPDETCCWKVQPLGLMVSWPSPTEARANKGRCHVYGGNETERPTS